MKRLNFFLTAIAAAFLCLPSGARAQPVAYNHPELNWQVIETEHFAVLYHQGAERTARTVAGIAERVYQPITDLYDYRPDGKIHWIIRDHDDYSNGAAYYYEQKIEIWAKPLDFEFRGTHHWLYDVVTHEFTHLIQLGAARKGPRWLPALYAQYINYEPEKRPDVLYGYPNRLISYPVAFTIAPMWFAEGTAQFQEQSVQHDWWDSHRDMIVRTRALEGKLLTYDEMGVFGKSSLGSESVYNHGYALVRYIAEEYGQQAVADLTAAMRRPSVWTFEQACRSVIGKGGRELYRSWVRDISADYAVRCEPIRANAIAGTTVHNDGFANLYPAFSPDGKVLAFLSNEGEDYLSRASLRLYHLESGKLTKPDSPVRGAFSWSPDGRFIAWAGAVAVGRNGSHYSDIYLWDAVKERDIRVTRDSRLSTPAFSPDGRRLAAIYNSDGTHNLAVVNLPDTLPDGDGDVGDRVLWRLLTFYNDGQQFYSPRWSPDGRTIYLAAADLGGRDIIACDAETGEITPIIQTSADERDPAVAADGAILFASDETGIFNLYRYDPATGGVQPITNVVGGAFMPAVGADGRVAFSEFTADGYRLNLLEVPQAVNREAMVYAGGASARPELTPPPRADGPSKPYQPIFNKLFILPRITWDYGVFKPGFYAYTGDILDKLTLFAGAAVNGRGDRDLYVNAEYRVLSPTLFLELFNIGRNESQSFNDPFVIIGERMVDTIAVPIYDTYSIDYSFNLSEVDLGGRVILLDDYTASGVFRWSSYKAALEFDDGGSFEYTYMLGRTYLLRLDSDQTAPSVTREIHPLGGWKGWLEYGLENNRFLDGFEVVAERGTLVEVYKPYNYHRVEADLDYYLKLYKRLVLNPRLGIGWLSKPVDPFFHLYAGGLPGLRGYSYYSLGGTRKAAARLSLRFPIAEHLDRQWGPLYFDRVNGALFTEFGDAWQGDWSVDRGVKRSVGGELRAGLFSWYGFPTDIQLTGAYGIDRFTVTDASGSHEYGGEWRWYFTVLFGFI